MLFGLDKPVYHEQIIFIYLSQYNKNSYNKKYNVLLFKRSIYVYNIC